MYRNNFWRFLPKFGRKRSHHVMDASCWYSWRSDPKGQSFVLSQYPARAGCFSPATRSNSDVPESGCFGEENGLGGWGWQGDMRTEELAKERWVACAIIAAVACCQCAKAKGSFSTIALPPSFLWLSFWFLLRKFSRFAPRWIRKKSWKRERENTCKEREEMGRFCQIRPRAILEW